MNKTAFSAVLMIPTVAFGAIAPTQQEQTTVRAKPVEIKNPATTQQNTAQKAVQPTPLSYSQAVKSLKFPLPNDTVVNRIIAIKTARSLTEKSLTRAMTQYYSSLFATPNQNVSLRMGKTGFQTLTGLAKYNSTVTFTWKFAFDKTAFNELETEAQRYAGEPYFMEVTKVGWIWKDIIVKLTLPPTSSNWVFYSKRYNDYKIQYNRSQDCRRRKCG